MASARREQEALGAKLRAEGAPWREVVAEFQLRWAMNARQAVRIARGMSQQDVANEWCQRWPDDPKTYKNISTWECWPNGGHMPSIVVMDRLAQVYRCSVGDLLADFDNHATDLSDLRHHDDVDRRSLLVGLGGTVAAAAFTPRGSRSARVPSEAAAYFQEQLDGHIRADVLVGPHLVINALTANYHALRDAIAASDGPLHHDLLAIAASYAAMAGWLHQDAGDLARSAAWRAESLEMAHRSGDLQLVSYALTNKAMLAVELGDGPGALDLSRANLSKASQLAPKSRVLALAQAAHGHALLGDQVEVDRSLDEMEELIGSVDDDWHWGNACRWTPSYVDAQRATAYGRLGLAHQSSDLWDSVIQQQPDKNRRDNGVYLARHATALTEAGEPAEAARKAAQAVKRLDETGSARLRLELVRLAPKARGWSHTSGGRELVDVLAAVA